MTIDDLVDIIAAHSADGCDWPVMVSVPGEELKPAESVTLDSEHKVLIITTE